MTARAELTEKIVRIKIERDLTWAGLAALAGELSKEYVTAALLGQMPLPGPAAEAMIPRMRAAIADYAWRNLGDYRAWPGPNSNTFVAAVLDAVPEARAVLPNTAIGKDYPYDGRWLRRTPSGTGIRLSLGGYAGVTLAWVEGIEVNILGGVAGLDLRRPAIKLPGLGRLGMAGPDGPSTPPAGPETPAEGVARTG